MLLPYSIKKNSAFTLVEVLITVGIMILISGALIPSFSSYIKNQNLVQAQEYVKSDLRSVQNKALTGVGASMATYSGYWGVKFVGGSSTYYYFITSTNPPTCPLVVPPLGTQGSGTIPAGVTPVATTCVFFSFAYGGFYAGSGAKPADIEIKLGTAAGSKSVFINGAGLIYSN